MTDKQWPGIQEGRDILFRIFRDEDRQEVPVGTFPYAAICALHVAGRRVASAQAAQSYGTGFLISPTRVVTAGHVVHAAGFRGESIVVIPQCTATHDPLGSHVIDPAAVEYFGQWQATHHYEDDLAVIKLSGPGVALDEYLTFEAASDVDIRRGAVEIAGYPTCVGTGCDNGINDLPAAYAGRTMFSHTQGVSHLSPTQIYSEIDTWEGQSGAPMLARSSGRSKVIGVHCRGPNQRYTDPHAKTLNSGVRMTADRINWVQTI